MRSNFLPMHNQPFLHHKWGRLVDLFTLAIGTLVGRRLSMAARTRSLSFIPMQPSITIRLKRRA